MELLPYQVIRIDPRQHCPNYHLMLFWIFIGSVKFGLFIDIFQHWDKYIYFASELVWKTNHRRETRSMMPYNSFKSSMLVNNTQLHSWNLHFLFHYFMAWDSATTNVLYSFIISYYVVNLTIKMCYDYSIKRQVL